MGDDLLDDARRRLAAKDARIAELTAALKALVYEFESVTRNSEHHFAYRNARAALAAVGEKKP